MKFYITLLVDMLGGKHLEWGMHRTPWALFFISRQWLDPVFECFLSWELLHIAQILWSSLGNMKLLAPFIRGFLILTLYFHCWFLNCSPFAFLCALSFKIITFGYTIVCFVKCVKPGVRLLWILILCSRTCCDFNMLLDTDIDDANNST